MIDQVEQAKLDREAMRIASRVYYWTNRDERLKYHKAHSKRKMGFKEWLEKQNWE